MGINDNIAKFVTLLRPYNAQLIAVTKTHPAERIREAYDGGHRLFGENKVQELMEKHSQLPDDIDWHLIGHLQRNKVKHITPFVSLIHSVDSLPLLEEINKQGQKINRVIHCLLQVHISTEETKFGLEPEKVGPLVLSAQAALLQHVMVDGLMGMASLTDNLDQVRNEFRSLKKVFEELKKMHLPPNIRMKELSMGMSSDFLIALEEGSTMVRVGSAVFGNRAKK